MRGGRGGSLRIILSAIETQSLEPQQIETPQLHRSSRACTSMHPTPRHCQQEPEDPEEDMPPVPPRRRFREHDKQGLEQVLDDPRLIELRTATAGRVCLF